MFKLLWVGLSIFVLLSWGTGQAQKGDPAKGKTAYATYCASCHGAAGKGDGAAAATLNPKPRDLTDAKYMATLTDQYMFDIIKKGGPAVGKAALMPPWGAALKDPEIQNVVAYIRTLVKK